MHIRVPNSKVKDHTVKNHCSIQPWNKHHRISTQKYTLPPIACITSLQKALHRSVGAKKGALRYNLSSPQSFAFSFLDSSFFFFLTNSPTRGLSSFWQNAIITEKQKEVWFSLTIVSVLSLTNESHIKVDLYKPWHQREENEGEKCIKTCKNNLYVKPDIYEHSSKKYLKINLWITAIWNVWEEYKDEEERKTNRMKCIDILKSLFI